MSFNKAFTISFFVATPPPKGGCYHDWVTPSDESGYCYKVYSPEDTGVNDQKQSWTNAYHQVKKCSQHCFSKILI